MKLRSLPLCLLLSGCLPADVPTSAASSSSSSSGNTATSRPSNTSTSNSSSTGLDNQSSASTAPDFVWPLPAGVPAPHVPSNNPQSVPKIELGRHLFFDTRLSRHNNRSCAICHEAKKGYTDGFARSIGTTFEMHTRNALSLANIGYQKMLTWDRPEPMSLEEQVLIPLLGTSPIEMGIADMQPQVLERLRAEPFYASQFPLAFPESPQPISIANVAKAIAAFERMLISRNSPFDRFLRGDHGALGSKAQAGYTLFSSERLGCTHCHSGPLLNLPKDGGSTPGFFNIGLYALKDTLRYPLRSRGLAVRTGKDQDDGKFRTPSLHNVALTRPYMHDGSVPTLEAVLDLYAAGGRNIQSEIPEHGDGRLHPFKDPRIRGFALSSDEKSAVIAFLESLTDPDFLHSTSLADPWPAGG